MKNKILVQTFSVILIIFSHTTLIQAQAKSFFDIFEVDHSTSGGLYPSNPSFLSTPANYDEVVVVGTESELGGQELGVVESFNRAGVFQWSMLFDTVSEIKDEITDASGNIYLLASIAGHEQETVAWFKIFPIDRKSTRLNSSHVALSRMPS